MLMKEHQSYPGYIVYSDGRIWSKKSHKFLKLTKDSDGYLELKTRQWRIKAHRLVAMCFLENSESLPEVNHKNGVKSDNNVDNLEWISSKNNMLHSYSTNLRPSGEDNVHAILTLEDVNIIRKSYIYRDSINGCAGLSRKFNVAEQTIRDIIKNRTWKNIA